MTNHLPTVTPPSELVRKWLNDFHSPYGAMELEPGEVALHITARAARWGADQELEACCKWLHWQNLATHPDLIPSLRTARRPKPPSLKKQALEALEALPTPAGQVTADRFDIIRRALEALDD